jgi:hypothetical protein
MKSAPVTLECCFVKRQRRDPRRGRITNLIVPREEPGRIPRVAVLLALALRFEELLREGQVRDYVELARLARVSRARITQVMNLLLLAPDIQEAILFLPPISRGRDPIRLALLQPIALTPSWLGQRRLWTALREQASNKTSKGDAKESSANCLELVFRAR